MGVRFQFFGPTTWAHIECRVSAYPETAACDGMSNAHMAQMRGDSVGMFQMWLRHSIQT